MDIFMHAVIRDQTSWSKEMLVLNIISVFATTPEKKWLKTRDRLEARQPQRITGRHVFCGTEIWDLKRPNSKLSKLIDF